MKPRCWLMVTCAVLGYSNLSGQTTVAVTTGGASGSSTSSAGAASGAPAFSPTNAAAAAAAGAAAAAQAALPAVTLTPIGPTPPVTGTTTTIVPPHVLSTIPSDARITNLSTRARVASDSPLITGFAISGSTPLTVLVRAIGPTLGAFGLTGTLAAPHLKLHGPGGAVIMENAGWGGAPALVTATAVAGAFPLPAGSADAVAVATLAPGDYSVEVGDDAGQGGVVLTEIYAMDGTAAGSQLVNVSARNTVAANGGEFISGFVVSGTMPAQFLIRGIGPGLAKFGMTGVLSDPVLTIFDSASQKMAINDDWNGGPKPGSAAVSAVGTGAQPVSGSGIVTATMDPDLVTAAAQATGAFALDANSLDAALVVALPPGAYTVQVTVGGTVVTTFTPSNVVPAPVVTTPTSGSTTAVVQPAATTASSGTVSLSFVPATPGVALLEIYQLP